jgi:tRNA(Arg) A34 adenosine deaminase TadA
MKSRTFWFRTGRENGQVLAEDHNRVGSGDPTRHPEFELTRWAAVNMDRHQRAASTLFTSGEHCPMCAAAHGWVGLGRIVVKSATGRQLQDANGTIISGNREFEELRVILKLATPPDKGPL